MPLSQKWNRQNWNAWDYFQCFLITGCDFGIFDTQIKQWDGLIALEIKVVMVKPQIWTNEIFYKSQTIFKLCVSFVKKIIKRTRHQKTYDVHKLFYSLWVVLPWDKKRKEKVNNPIWYRACKCERSNCFEFVLNYFELWIKIFIKFCESIHYFNRYGT